MERYKGCGKMESRSCAVPPQESFSFCVDDPIDENEFGD